MNALSRLLINRRRLSIDRRRLLGGAFGAAGTAALGLPASVWAEAPFPQRPITLLLPWPAGGATDVLMRDLAERAAVSLQQKVLVENRAGAGGTLAMPTIKGAAADGYTIAQLPQPALRRPWLQSVPWDPVADTTPIIQLTGVTFGIVVPASSAIRTLDDLIAQVKARPSAITIATNGVGTTPHQLLEKLLTQHGLRYTHVPFKGTSEQMLAVAGAQVMAGVNSNGFAPFVESGKLRLLATTGAERMPRWPQVPTLKELGHGVVATSPYGLVGPRGLPPAIVRTLHDAFKAALLSSGHLAELAKFEQEPMYLDSAAYGQALQAAYLAERDAVKASGAGASASA